MRRPAYQPPRTTSNAVTLLVLSVVILAIFTAGLVVAVITKSVTALIILAAIYWFGYREYPGRIIESVHAIRRNRDLAKLTSGRAAPPSR